MSSSVENLRQSTITSSGKLSTHKTKSTMFGERRTLQTLQPSMGDGLTRPTHGSKKDGKSKGKIIATKKPLHIFEDPEPILSLVSPTGSLTSTPKGKSTPKESTPVTSTPTGPEECSCTCHERTEEEDLVDFMTADTTMEEWKSVAEERRQALDESLAENRQLHFEVADYKEQVEGLSEEMSELREESRRLSEQRDYFANILQKLVEDEEGADTDENAASSTDSDTADSALPDTQQESLESS